MIWQYPMLGNVKTIDWFLVPWHGLPLDLSVAGYLTCAIGVLLCMSVWIDWRIIRKIIVGYTCIILFVSIWTILGDNGCFPSWGYHLDKDIFAYLRSPQEALACAPWWVWIGGVFGFCLLFFVWGFFYLKLVDSKTLENPTRKIGKKIVNTFILLLVTGFLFLPIRGSVTVSTMNTGRVYFSNNRMLNLAAVNPIFNIVESISENNIDGSRYHYFFKEQADLLMSDLKPNNNTVSGIKENLFSISRPNIILCIMESFSLNAMEAGAMPCLKQMAEEGVFFSRCFANSYRTDRGVMAVLGAFPGCATTSLMMIPSKTQHLPQIGNVLKDEGYNLKFYYGGDEDFTNMRSFLVSGGFEERISDQSFPVQNRLSKWGVPDHILMPYTAEDIIKRQQDNDAPCFSAILSLSSHEPFEVPYHHFDHPYLNAIAYSDSCLGAFINTLKNSAEWDSTVVVMVADHGYPFPDYISSFDTLHYRIPLVMVGGAVQHAMRVNTLCSQIDWVPTILHQMDLPSQDFVFAKDILNPNQEPYAYYHFVDGFALLRDTNVVIIDAAVNQPITEDNVSHTLADQARALTQTIMDYIAKL